MVPLRNIMHVVVVPNWALPIMSGLHATMNHLRSSLLFPRIFGAVSSQIHKTYHDVHQFISGDGALPSLVKRASSAEVPFLNPVLK